MAKDNGARRLAERIVRHRWIPTVIWAVAIFVVSSVPELTIKSEPFPGCDKVVHFIEYSILGIALRYWSGRPRKTFLIGGVAFGGLDELHQRFVPGRVTSFWDFVADACGILVGFFVGKIFVRKVVND
jgi:VanZ family protein